MSHNAMPIRNPQSAIRNRPGAVLLTVLICLTIGSLMFGVVLRTGLAERRLVRAQERQMQAALLAESALERAAARLAADRDYREETWTISADELGAEGVVQIKVETNAASGSGRIIRVQADYPAKANDRARESRQRTIDG
jgi:hypothetical protein